MFASMNTYGRIAVHKMTLIFQATVCTLRTAVVRKIDQEPYLSLSFMYSHALVKERKFSFVRSQSEPLKILCKKIQLTIKKELVGTVIDTSPPSQKVEFLQKNLKEIEEVAVYFNGSKVNGDLENKLAFNDGAVLKIGDKEFKIKINTPNVISLSIDKNTMAGFSVIPNVKLEFGNIKDSKFMWYRSEPQSISESDTVFDSDINWKFKKAKTDFTKLKWEEVGHEFIYRSAFDDVNRYLKVKCIPGGNGCYGLPEEAVSVMMVKNGPGSCPFHNRHVFTQYPAKDGRFRIMSYNVLADTHADSNFSRTELFPTCPPYALASDYRKQLLLQEIQGYNCDVICLQEVDAKIFDNFLMPTFQCLNYESIFSRKGGKHDEGLACFYNKSKFSLINHQEILLSKALETESVLADLYENISRKESLKEKILNRITTLQVIMLKPLDVPDRKLCIANNHLHSKPERCDIRLLQASITLRYLEEYIRLESSRNPNCSVALVLAGDFNSCPEYGVYQLMTTKFIPKDHPDWKYVSEDVIENFSFSHPFSLKSAYGTPPYTNYVKDFFGCLDYVFSDESLLAVEEVVPLPSHEEVTQHQYLPSITVPSDHLALVCTLKWL